MAAMFPVIGMELVVDPFLVREVLPEVCFPETRLLPRPRLLDLARASAFAFAFGAWWKEDDPMVLLLLMMLMFPFWFSVEEVASKSICNSERTILVLSSASLVSSIGVSSSVTGGVSALASVLAIVSATGSTVFSTTFSTTG